MRNVVEERPNLPALLPAGRFDLDHIGPEIAQQLAAELALFIRQFEHSQSRQRSLGAGHWAISSW